MKRERHIIEEGGSKAPVYIVTFSTLVTLLLAFFVVLVSMGTVQDRTLLDTGSDIQLVKKGLGIGEKFDFGHTKILYHTGDANESSDGRCIDANGERIRRIIKKLAQNTRIMPSQIAGEKANLIVTDIRFTQGEASLNEDAKRFLVRFCMDLDSKASSIYVLALAGQEATAKDQWLLSAKRANAAAEFLEHTLPATIKRPIYSWGAGPGGDWVGQDSPISKQSQIYIAVIQPSTN